MTTYQFVTGYYNHQRKSIDMWCRSEEGKKELLSVMGFDPYMYVPEAEFVPEADWITEIIDGFDFMDGSKVKRIVTTDPIQVREHRGEFSIAHEAKTRFVQRMLIDVGLRSSFETNVRSGVIPYELIKPIDMVMPPLVVYMDIETKSRVRFPNWRNPKDPVISVSFWDTLYRKYITVMLDTFQNAGMREVGDWVQYRVTKLRELVDICCGYLSRVKGDILTGWNIEFDINYFNAWMEKNYDVKLPTYGYEIFDLASAYKKIRGSLGNRLKEVVIREGVVKPEDMVAKEFHIELYEDPNTRNQFMKYNVDDVRYCVALDRGFRHVKTGEWIEHNLIERFWDEKNFAGLTSIEDASSHVKRHDVLWMRMAREMGIVLPTSPDKVEGSKLDYGGIVFNPAPGLYPNVTVIDMNRYYPNILRAFAKETSPDVWGKLGPAVIEHLSAERDRYEAELKNYEPGSAQYKIAERSLMRAKNFLSGAWGYFVYPGSRIYSREKGNFVLKTAGEGLELLRKESTRLGHVTQYGDTDSIFIEALMDEVEDLVGALNDVLKSWAEEKGVPTWFRVKEDRYARNSLFIRSKKGEVGVKKRYAQHIIREGWRPCDYVLIKGFEYARGNTSEVTRGVQQRSIESVVRLDTDGLVQFLQEEIRKIRAMEYDIDDIVVPINLGMKVEEGRRGEYYWGALYNNEYLKEEIVEGDRVRFFKVGKMPPGYPMPKGRWLSYIDKWNLPRGTEVDLDWVIDRTVRSPIERVLEAADISWMNVLGVENLGDFFV